MKKRTIKIDESEWLTILESAWFALRNHFDDLAYYLDLSDREMEKLRANVRARVDEQIDRGER